MKDKERDENWSSDCNERKTMHYNIMYTYDSNTTTFFFLPAWNTKFEPSIYINNKMKWKIEIERINRECKENINKQQPKKKKQYNKNNNETKYDKLVVVIFLPPLFFLLFVLNSHSKFFTFHIYSFPFIFVAFIFALMNSMFFIHASLVQ